MRASCAEVRGRGTRPGPLPPENMSGHTKKLRFFVERLSRYLERHRRPAALLDFGCGNGSAVSRFLMLPNVRYYGVDVHEPSLAYADEHYGSANASFLRVVPQDVVFDVIVYSDILEHLDDPESHLRRYAASHSASGLLVGCVPNGYGPFENEKRLDRWLKISALLDLPARMRRRRGAVPAPDAAALPYNAGSGHVQFFTRRSLVATLGRAGYRVTDFRNGAFVGAPLSERYVFRGERVARWNAAVADHLPYWAVSTWLFAAVKET